NEGDHTAHSRGNFVTGLPGNGFSTITFGPDGDIYTSRNPFMSIGRYDGTTGEFIDQFIMDGRIKEARDIVFRSGFLYVGSEFSDEVLRYNANTGEFVDVFVTAG